MRDSESYAVRSCLQSIIETVFNDVVRSWLQSFIETVINDAELEELELFYP
jgi:hypothetical protein